MMGPFLAGFCSELLKTAFADSSPTPVPATGSPTTQRPLGAAAAPSRPSESGRITGPVVGAGVGAPEYEQWRPSPKYTPKPDPKGEDPKPSKGSGKPKLPSRMPWGTFVGFKGETNPGAPYKPRPTKAVPAGQKGAVTDSTTYKQLYESGAMPRSAYEKLNEKERVSSHVPKYGPYSRPVQESVTAKEWMNPNDYDPHTGQMTARAKYQIDHPMKTTGLRGKGGSYAIPTIGEKQAPQKIWTENVQANSQAMKEWMDRQEQIKIGPQEQDWGGQDKLWQNRPVATAKDLTKGQE